MAFQSRVYQVKRVTTSKAEEALAALLANTKRQQRKLSLIEISKYLSVAEKYYGGIGEVANLIGLSPKMLNQFKYVSKLSKSARKYFSDRKIESVDIAVHLSSLSPKDQDAIVSEISAGRMTSEDVRAVKYLRGKIPHERIKKVIGRVLSSKNIKEYVIAIRVQHGKKNDDVLARIREIVGNENVVFDTEKRITKIILNADGKKRLESEAKQQGLTKVALIKKIVDKQT